VSAGRAAKPGRYRRRSASGRRMSATRIDPQGVSRKFARTPADRRLKNGVRAANAVQWPELVR
jgi:hypothetical protein